jgi:hypothetical protein
MRVSVFCMGLAAISAVSVTCSLIETDAVANDHGEPSRVDCSAITTTPDDCENHKGVCSVCQNYYSLQWKCINNHTEVCCNDPWYPSYPDASVGVCKAGQSCLYYTNGSYTGFSCCDKGLMPCQYSYLTNASCYDPAVSQCCYWDQVPGPIPVLGNVCELSAGCCGVWGSPFCCAKGTSCCGDGYSYGGCNPEGWTQCAETCQACAPGLVCNATAPGGCSKAEP